MAFFLHVPIMNPSGSRIHVVSCGFGPHPKTMRRMRRPGGDFLMAGGMGHWVPFLSPASALCPLLIALPSARRCHTSSRVEGRR